jgi:hypothetical protein
MFEFPLTVGGNVYINPAYVTAVVNDKNRWENQQNCYIHTSDGQQWFVKGTAENVVKRLDEWQAKP